MSEYNDCPALSSGIPEVCIIKCQELRREGKCMRGLVLFVTTNEKVKK